MTPWVSHLKKSKSARLAAVFLAITFIVSATFFHRIATPESEIGGPSQKSFQSPVPNAFLYEKREVLAYRPNGLNRMQVTGYLKNFTGEETLLYSFIDDPYERAAKKRSLIPTAHITPDHHIFISGVGEKNFVVLNHYGDNITEKYDFLKDHFPFGNFMEDANGNVYFTKADRVIYQYRREDKKVLPLASFPFAETFYPQIEGISNDGNFLYISKRGQASFAEFFRLNIAEKTISPYESLKGTRNDQLIACPEKGTVVYIKHALDPSHPPYGEPIGPSSIMLMDLQSDTSSEVLASDALFTDMRLSCQAERILVKEKNQWRLVNLAGTLFPSNLQTGDDAELSSDNGEKSVVRNLLKLGPNIFRTSLRSFKNAKEEWSVEDVADDGGKAPKISYTVVGAIR